jgi:hypothetical protein
LSLEASGNSGQTQFSSSSSASSDNAFSSDFTVPPDTPTTTPTPAPSQTPTFAPIVFRDPNHCVPGTYKDNNECISCEEGKYQNIYNALSKSDCKNVPLGYYPSGSKLIDGIDKKEGSQMNRIILSRDINIKKF